MCYYPSLYKVKAASFDLAQQPTDCFTESRSPCQLETEAAQRTARYRDPDPHSLFTLIINPEHRPQPFSGFVCLCVKLLHFEYQNTRSSKVGTFFTSEDILPGAHNFKGLFEASDVDFKVGVGVLNRVRVLIRARVLILQVQVRLWPVISTCGSLFSFT